MTPYDWANGGSVDVFPPGEYGFTYKELMLLHRMGMEFKNKIMLNCFREKKCKQGFTTGIWYYNVLRLTVRMYISGLMDSKSE